MEIASIKQFTILGKSFPTSKSAAEYFKVSQAFMSMVFLGKKPPTKAMLKKLGYRKIVNKTVTYEELKKKHPSPTLPKEK